MTLFPWGEFTAASGRVLDWKVECDALTDRDWRTFALLVKKQIPPVREVIGIPTGGKIFAGCLIDVGVLAPGEWRPRLIVDDVWTTGKSVAELYEPGDLVVVAFARAPVPPHVWPIWQLGEAWQ